MQQEGTGLVKKATWWWAGGREREETCERFTVTHPDRSAGKLGGRVEMFRVRDGGKKWENAHVRHNKRKKKKQRPLGAGGRRPR